MSGKKATTTIIEGDVALSVGFPKKLHPAGWKYILLTNIAELATGHTPSRKHPEYWNGDIPWMSVGDARHFDGKVIFNTKEKTNSLGIKKSAAVLLPKNTVCLSRTASIGYSILLGNEMATSQGFVNWICSNDLNPRFLQLLFLSEKRFLYSISEGTAHTTIYFPEVKAFHIALPSIIEQNRIVAKLDQLFAHLETAKKGLEKIPTLLKEFRQAVLTQAVTGKLTEEWREGKELGVIDPKKIDLIRNQDIKNCNDELEKNERRKQKVTPFRFFCQNEYGWLISNVESACIFIVDCLHNTPKFENEGYHVVDTTCISSFKIDWQKARKVNKENFNIWTERLIPNYGDILFSREGTIGVAVKVPKDKELCIGQRMMLFRMGSYVIPEFAEIYFNSYIFRDEYMPHVKGVAAQHLNIGSIRELNFPIPTIKEQTEIVRRVEALFAKADAIEERYKSLKEKIDHLPQAILGKAFSGEL